MMGYAAWAAAQLLRHLHHWRDGDLTPAKHGRYKPMSGISRDPLPSLRRHGAIRILLRLLTPPSRATLNAAHHNGKEDPSQ